MRRTAFLVVALTACSQSHGLEDVDSGGLGSGDGAAGLEGCFVMGTDPPECCPAEPEYYVPVGGLCRAGTAAASLCQGPCIAPATCDEPSDCAVASEHCCFCREPTIFDVVAIPAGAEAAHHERICGADVACPPCAAAPNPYLVATCAGELGCAVVDLHATPAYGCFSDDECTLLYASCCGCSGTEDEVISVRTTKLGDVDEILCGAGGCTADCVRPAITTHTARCVESRCQAVLVPR